MYSVRLIHGYCININVKGDCADCALNYAVEVLRSSHTCLYFIHLSKSEHDEYSVVLVGKCHFEEPSKALGSHNADGIHDYWLPCV